MGKYSIRFWETHSQKSMLVVWVITLANIIFQPLIRLSSWIPMTFSFICVNLMEHIMCSRENDIFGCGILDHNEYPWPEDPAEEHILHDWHRKLIDNSSVSVAQVLKLSDEVQDKYCLCYWWSWSWDKSLI